ncbi:2-polyprenyl-6-methoxyphenol hydroxylase [Micromonospora phaseoli]|uniref:2-polyprenyl-6-methoxyphenol hydroxylase n=1 Tax=Micromonospora phaseoli TaxID=1144548 RepID=A0A1H7C0P7_9ACTN|nr:2-polyprenyl-6-methoxyphenol hydroxylase-like FAD-dependent oxidoreductase [Micromonospora phaseoli]GIJ76652.1 FAD-dependent oxidoreductase [Micromonospora phaseoli]SEJ83281.1 2-polyprenyl-6-methoxyphenol hydroxylase [Micromonospora phaseoli]
MTGHPHALVVGAGIAGTAVGLVLRRIGWRVTLLEARPEREQPLGSYFSLADNGRTVLRGLGILPAVEAVGTATHRISFHDHRGREIGSNNQASTLIRRDRLGGALREAARRAGVRIIHDARMVGLCDDGVGGAVATLADRSSHTGDLLIGADGVHSRTRRLMFPEHPSARFTGVLDGGGSAPRVDGIAPDGVLRLTFGNHAFFGHQALPGGEVVWFQSMLAGEEDLAAGPRADPVDRWRTRLVELHRSDHRPISDIIEASTGTVIRWPVYDLDPPSRWSRGRVCLIGDAAHAMPPHDGQSASMALEDALVLARCLDTADDISDALVSFQQLREPRVTMVAGLTRRTGSLKFPTAPRARRARDAVLGMFIQAGVAASEDVNRYHLDWPELAGHPEACRPDGVSTESSSSS